MNNSLDKMNSSTVVAANKSGNAIIISGVGGSNRSRKAEKAPGSKKSQIRHGSNAGAQTRRTSASTVVKRRSTLAAAAADNSDLAVNSASTRRLRSASTVASAHRASNVPSAAVAHGELFFRFS